MTATPHPEPGVLTSLLTYSQESPLLFNSGAFLVLFAAFYAVLLALKERRLPRTLWTVAFSLFFYYRSSGYYFWILLVSTVVDYVLGRAMARVPDGQRRRLLLLGSVVANLGILGYFKYTNFLFDTASSLGLGQGRDFDIFLPVGISFYTFQTLSYAVDVYRRKIEPERDILDFAFYVTFFPQLVAGPIVRAADFLPQLRNRLRLSHENLGRALLLICGGLIKKAVISDYVSVNFVDRVFDQPLLYTGFENLLAVYGYAVQIYCDFSGYSDMAIGLALLMGFRIPENFNLPYKATSITDFWRRWHISLSSWLRDYLYISLGGNRKGRWRTYRNLMLTMLLGGLWHGAAWKFVAWGGLHGAALAVEKRVAEMGLWRPTRWTRFATGVATFHFVGFCWIFFRARSFGVAAEMLGRIGDGFDLAQAAEVLAGYRNVALMIALGFVLHWLPTRLRGALTDAYLRAPLPAKALALWAVIWVVVQTAAADVQPFIYFQF